MGNPCRRWWGGRGHCLHCQRFFQHSIRSKAFKPWMHAWIQSLTDWLSDFIHPHFGCGLFYPALVTGRSKFEYFVPQLPPITAKQCRDWNTGRGWEGMDGWKEDDHKPKAFHRPSWWWCSSSCWNMCHCFVYSLLAAVVVTILWVDVGGGRRKPFNLHSVSKWIFYCFANSQAGRHTGQANRTGRTEVVRKNHDQIHWTWPHEHRSWWGTNISWMSNNIMHTQSVLNTSALVLVVLAFPEFQLLDPPPATTAGRQWRQSWCMWNFFVLRPQPLASHTLSVVVHEYREWIEMFCGVDVQDSSAGDTKNNFANVHRASANVLIKTELGKNLHEMTSFISGNYGKIVRQ